jgi:thioredoxin 1
MATVKVTKDNFDAEVLKSDRPVLIDFWAAWCGPCKMVSPMLEEIAEENPDVKVVKINVDEEVQLASQFNIRSIPTMMVFKNGEPVNTSIGARPKAEILKLVK